MTPTEALARLREYPYDITPAITALSLTTDLDDPALPELCARIAVAMPSHRSYEDLLGDRAYIMSNFYPVPEEVTPSTDDTISTFLSTFGAGDPAETDALTRLIFNPTPDYAATLAAEERATPITPPAAGASEQDRLIHNFLAAATPSENSEISENSERSDNSETQPAPETIPEAAEKPSLTESFVRILIKNRNYTKALEIISEINLKNPEKSIYFADQIRFLKKLIINENKK
ncbi:MAG: hypothetical protein HDS66_08165 [Bacteroidales bacterium]|nr:hypothetical protein [Bacteroidales bacterium]